MLIKKKDIESTIGKGFLTKSGIVFMNLSSPSFTKENWKDHFSLLEMVNLLDKRSFVYLLNKDCKSQVRNLVENYKLYDGDDLIASLAFVVDSSVITECDESRSLLTELDCPMNIFTETVAAEN